MSGKFPQHIGLFLFNTIAAATEHGIKQTKPSQEGLELHGTHHSLCWWWFIAQNHTINTDSEAVMGTDKKVDSDANNQNIGQNHNLKIAIKGLANFKYYGTRLP